MWCKMFSIAAVVVLAQACRADDKPNLFKDCKQAATVPAALKETYTKFAGAAKAGSGREALQVFQEIQVL